MTITAAVLIEDVPDAVRTAVDADAQARNMNRNDLVCEILADRFRVPFEPSGYPWREGEGATQWNLRMTPELRAAIKRYAKNGSGEGRSLTQRGLVLSTLQAHYDLPVQSPRRRSGHPPLSPDLVREARARHDAGESFRALSRRYGVKRETLAKAIRSA